MKTYIIVTFKLIICFLAALMLHQPNGMARLTREIPSAATICLGKIPGLQL